jgi:predicted ATPase
LLDWQYDIPPRYFATYEALEIAFRERIADLVPRFHAGTRSFWEDFQRLYHQPQTARLGDDAYITSNPRDCLAFGTPFQVLQGAWLSAPRSRITPGAVADRFGLTGHLHQSIRSLSGGETVRLALAKAYLLAERATRLTVASPFSWLSLDHWTIFQNLIERYRSCDTALELFALEGEDSRAPVARREGPPPDPVAFTWRLDALRLDLGTLLDRLHDRPVWAGVDPVEETLASPCLLCGDNGQGKSLIAKVLASAIPFRGRVTMTGTDGPLQARLLFQDVLNQTLMRSMGQLTPRGDADRVARVYDEVLAGMRDSGPRSEEALLPFAERQRISDPLSLLEIKILLTARRLIDPRAVFIMDEPDWGLSRSDALAFVASVVDVAHARAVPVMLISHKPWWQNLACSMRWIRKQRVSPARSDGCLFNIQILNEPGDMR